MSNQQNLTEAQWIAWQQSHAPIDCVQSSVIGDLKAELEKLCSVAPCSYETEEQVKQAVEGLKRLIEIGRVANQ